MLSVNGKPDDWKMPYRCAIEASMTFFGNDSKFEREKWVAERLLETIGVDFAESDLLRHGEPTDVGVLGAAFQVKELMDDGRRRSDEFKDQMDVLDNASSEIDLAQQYMPKSISFSEVVDLVALKAAELESEKYGPAERKNMDLLCYFNYMDYGVVPPLQHSISNSRGFRSISVVTNRYCAVLFSTSEAPEFLLKNVNYVGEYGCK